MLLFFSFVRPLPTLAYARLFCRISGFLVLSGEPFNQQYLPNMFCIVSECIFTAFVLEVAH